MRLHPFVACLALFAATSSFSQAAELCGDATPCIVKGGDYRIAVPRDGDVRGAYVYFHGFKSSGELQMQQSALVSTTLAHHLAYVAVNGINGSWSFPHGPQSSRDENAFIANVFDDLHTRFGFPPEKTILGGFSIGASMAWYTACRQGDRVAAMITFSGVFWDPLPKPDDCIAKLPPIVHFHGRADQTFPLSGRAIGAQYHQGNAIASMEIMRTRAECHANQRKAIRLDDIDCDDVPGCIRGDSIMCVHGGGHEARADMLDAGLTAVGFPM